MLLGTTCDLDIRNDMEICELSLASLTDFLRKHTKPQPTLLASQNMQISVTQSASPNGLVHLLILSCFSKTTDLTHLFTGSINSIGREAFHGISGELTS